MSDMIAIFGVLLIVALGFPALLLLVWLAFPATVARAQQRVAHTPLRCFWLGLAILLALTLPLLLLLSVPGPGQFLGALLLILILTLATIGAAGVAAHVGGRVRGQLAPHATTPGGFLIGATALELAVAFPVIGWIVALPVLLLLALGATAFALLRWQPKRAAETQPQEPPFVYGA
jgi:hypothetical protein